MKVLLLEDVYNLGRAGEVKKVANGYGRNYLITQGLAILATQGALSQAERITEEADRERMVLNKEMSVIADKLKDVRLVFPARAGETGKLYGSITTQMIADTLNEKLGTDLSKRQIDSQPLRLLGMHTIKVRLTIDLIPEFSVVVYREGESPDNYLVDAEVLAEESYDAEEGEEAADPAIQDWIGDFPSEAEAGEELVAQAELIEFSAEDEPAPEEAEELEEEEE